MTCCRRLFCVALLWASAGMIGCEGAPAIYTPTGGGYLGADISRKNSWSVRGNLANPPAAVDGNLATFARSGNSYRGAELTIDLKKVCLFQTVIIDHGSREHEHCRRTAVATSVDGAIFRDRYVAPGTRRLTILCLPGPVLARYLRLRAEAPGPRRWSIAEVYVQ